MMSILNNHAIRISLLVCFGWLVTACTGAQIHNGFDLESEIRPFAVETGNRFDISTDRVVEILTRARIDDRALKLIRRPAEAMLWRDYRKIFLTPSRIEGGVGFWRQHADDLQAAEEKFGVAQEIIVAIIGVETLYGTRKGKIRVLDALATLGFRYPKRGRFFRSELQHYLMLVDSEKLDPLVLRGSYAGAMGIPQFISSSYRHYAVDFNNDQVRDLMNSESDAIGSVGNYLARHGWQAGMAITEAVMLNPGTNHQRLQDRGLKPHTRVSEMQSMGVKSKIQHQHDPLSALIVLQGNNGREFWLGFKNFYVITRYNHSPLYAMAVHQLAMEIKAKYRMAGE